MTYRSPQLLSCLAAALLSACVAEKEPAPEIPRPPETGGVVEGAVPATDGAVIAYSDQGLGEPALVFVHGWACDRSFWREQAPVFARNHRVVTLDLPGHGRSGAERLDWSFEALGEDVAQVVEALALQRVILVGHSMGGPVALEAAALMPERVLGVVAVDALHSAEMEYDRARWEGYLALYRQGFEEPCGMFVGSMFLPGADAELKENIRRSMCERQRPDVAIALLEVFPDYDLKEALAAAGVPIRVINSTALPTEVELNRKYAADFDAVTVDGVGHFLMLERPLLFNTALAGAIAELTAGQPAEEEAGR